MEEQANTAVITPDLTIQVANGFMASKHLFVANEVGLFAALADSVATLDEVVQRVAVPRRTLRILADAKYTYNVCLSKRSHPN